MAKSERDRLATELTEIYQTLNDNLPIFFLASKQTTDRSSKSTPAVLNGAKALHPAELVDWVWGVSKSTA
jgi:hypothetical protein